MNSGAKEKTTELSVRLIRASLVSPELLGVKLLEIKEKVKWYKKEIAESVKVKNEKLKEGVYA